MLDARCSMHDARRRGRAHRRLEVSWSVAGRVTKRIVWTPLPPAAVGLRIECIWVGVTDIPTLPFCIFGAITTLSQRYELHGVLLLVAFSSMHTIFPQPRAGERSSAVAKTRPPSVPNQERAQHDLNFWECTKNSSPRIDPSSEGTSSAKLLRGAPTAAATRSWGAVGKRRETRGGTRGLATSADDR